MSDELDELDDDELAELQAKIAAKRRSRGSLARAGSTAIGSAERGRAMYGDETAEEAQRRWLLQEQQDMNGVLGPGGMSAGGIFGDGAIVTEGYDPAAQMRGEARLIAMERAQAARERSEDRERIARLETQLARALGEDPPAERLPSGPGPYEGRKPKKKGRLRRLLGR